MRTAVVFVLFLLFAKSGWPQRDSSQARVLLNAGFGNYEYLHLGIDRNFTHRNAYIELGAGINPFAKNETYAMGYFNLGGYFFSYKPTRKLSPGIHVNTIYWKLANGYNEFKVFGAGLAAKINYRISPLIELHVNAGYLYNSIVFYTRKTYDEVGWPKQWQPSFSVQLKFRLK